MALPETLTCETCDAEVPAEAVRRAETMGGLDSEKWQPLCGPDCGNRLQTVFVSLE